MTYHDMRGWLQGRKPSARGRVYIRPVPRLSVIGAYAGVFDLVCGLNLVLGFHQPLGYVILGCGCWGIWAWWSQWQRQRRIGT